MPDRSDTDQAAWRELFPVTRDWAFFNHAAIAAPSSRTRKAMLEAIDSQMTAGSQAYYSWAETIAAARQRLATLVGSTAQDLAFIPNTSTGLALIAEGYPWRTGDAVLVPVPDFPANVYPWQHLERRGVRVIAVPRRNGALEVEDFDRQLTPATRMLVVSSVDYTTGYRTDLADLGRFCRQHGLIFGVDAIQSLGVETLAVEQLGIDFLAAGAHKWLLGPVGIGLLYVSRRLRERLTPPLVGWKSVTDEEDFRLHFDLRQDAAALEPGTLNFPGIAGLEAAVALLQKVGMVPIQAKVTALVDRLAEGLQARDFRLAIPHPQQRCGILSFIPPGDPHRLFGQLQKAGIALAVRGPFLRLSPHFYNNTADIDRLWTALDDRQSAQFSRAGRIRR